MRFTRTDCENLREVVLAASVLKQTHSMKVTLRNRRTGEFLDPSGNWVSTALKARDFLEPDLAIQHCRSLKLPDVHVFYIFDDPRLDFGSPVNCAETAARA